MRRRVNVTLPEETLERIDRLARKEKSNRSRLLDEAARYYILVKGSANLKRLLKEGALAHARENLELAEEWFPLEEEAWRKRRR